MIHGRKLHYGENNIRRCQSRNLSIHSFVPLSDTASFPYSCQFLSQADHISLFSSCANFAPPGVTAVLAPGSSMCRKPFPNAVERNSGLPLSQVLTFKLWKPRVDLAPSFGTLYEPHNGLHNLVLPSPHLPHCIAVAKSNRSILYRLEVDGDAEWSPELVVP